MLLMVGKGKKSITWGICNSIYQYTKVNNKYMENNAKNGELPYLQYWNVNNI